MADRAHVDLVLLESIAGVINRSGGLLGASRGGLSLRSDGGEATPIFTELLSQVSESTARLLIGR